MRINLYDSDMKELDIVLGWHELKLLKLPFLHHFRKVDNILSWRILDLQQHLYLENTWIDNLPHKIVHTFEKMDAINPTFESISTKTRAFRFKVKPYKQP